MCRDMYKNIEQRLVKVFQILSVFLFFLLFFYSLGMTGINKELTDETIYFQPDSVMENLLGIGIFIFAIEIIQHFGSRIIKNQYHMDKAALFVSIMIGFFCCLWIYMSNTVPQADQKAVCDYAALFNQGDYAALEKGGYVGVYQQQLGLISFMRLILLLGGGGTGRSNIYRQVWQGVWFFGDIR